MAPHIAPPPVSLPVPILLPGFSPGKAGGWRHSRPHTGRRPPCTAVVLNHSLQAMDHWAGPLSAPGSRTLTCPVPHSNMEAMNWAIAAGVKNCPMPARVVRSVEPLTDWRIWPSACKGVMFTCVAERPLDPSSPWNSTCSSPSPKPDPVTLRTTQLPETIQKANSRSMRFGKPFQSLIRPARINKIRRRLRPLLSYVLRALAVDQSFSSFCITPIIRKKNAMFTRINLKS